MYTLEFEWIQWCWPCLDTCQAGWLISYLFNGAVVSFYMIWVEFFGGRKLHML